MSPVSPLALPKTCLLRKPRDYRVVYQRGRRIRGRQITIIYTPNGTGQNRLGISIHGVKKAVDRNRIKRLIREYFRLNRLFICPASDIVFAIRKGFSAKNSRELKKNIEQMVEGSFAARPLETP